MRSRSREPDERAAGQHSVADNLPLLLHERALNLRQIFWRAHRGLNEKIAEKFIARGYAGFRPAYLTVLGNMSLGETSVATLAERAQVAVEGVRPIARELERLGYLIIAAGAPAENVSINFTDAGWELMLTSFNILREIEAEYETRLQPGDLDQLRRICGTLFG